MTTAAKTTTKLKFLLICILTFLACIALAIDVKVYRKNQRIAELERQVYRLELDLEYAVNRCAEPLASDQRTNKSTLAVNWI